MQVIHPNNNMVQAMFTILQKLNKIQIPTFYVLLSSISKSRYNKIWNNLSETCQSICVRADSLLESWKRTQNIKQNGQQPPVTANNVRWQKPVAGRYKCNLDASFSSEQNKVGIGICIRDEHDSFVLARTDWLYPPVDVDIGEALGLLTALQWLRDLQLQNVDFEVDSKSVVDSVYGKRIMN